MTCSDFCFRRKTLDAGVFQGEQGEAGKLGGGWGTGPSSRECEGI